MERTLERTGTGNSAAVEPPAEWVEAVIISGPRKGELIRLDGDGEPQLTAEEDALLDSVIVAARRMAENAKALGEATKSLSAELRETNRRLRESI